MKNSYRSLLLLFIVAYLTPAQNYSLSFDGNSYVSVPHSDNLNLSNQLTIECWFTVQGSSLNDWLGMVCKMEATAVPNSGYFFGLNVSTGIYANALQFRIYPSLEYIDSSFSPTLNQWYNLAITYNGSIMKMFLDGNLIREKAATSLIASNTFPLTIGGQNGNFWNRNLNGKIDEVRISSVARYESNFTPTTHFDNDLYTRALYHFNEGTGDTVYDSSGNNNNGTIYGAIWSNDVPGVTTVPEEMLNELDEFVLSQNYPNPFNPNTQIKFSIPKSSQVTLKIINTLGEEIEILVNEEKAAGTYELSWNAANLPSGVYFYRLQAGDPSTSSGQSFVQTRKMILLK
jgi:Concanavalin A-like lectin/glucanases superfamily/Secretion system C-terminal sorting domain